MVLIATLFEVNWNLVAYIMQYARGCKAMIGENRQLVTNEPVEFEK